MSAQDKHNLKTELTQLIKERLRVRPDIELVPPFSLPRESGKISLIEIKK
jgi:phenylacetate-coenzyme A ligase PaaK-like adenylate-forming protein